MWTTHVPGYTSAFTAFLALSTSSPSSFGKRRTSLRPTFYWSANCIGCRLGLKQGCNHGSHTSTGLHERRFQQLCDSACTRQDVQLDRRYQC
ncbi:hypothetical protein CVIRNUC_001166 [Coccomyxa viridis]|uniref:Secreted protein n=1 Tax=Coccomyxa viridis TaxID=1274662 RepID=A0AAV1HTA0_9CHLO|nr:hypothetical protein CVIRNUC_001166 [Coccomyxa viridis]